MPLLGALYQNYLKDRFWPTAAKPLKLTGIRTLEFSSNWLVDRLLILPTTSAPKPGQKRLMLALRNFNRHRLQLHLLPRLALGQA